MQSKIVLLDFAEIRLFDTYAISTIKEGIVFQRSHFEASLEVFDAHFKGKPFVSIANRINDYTVDPQIFMTSRSPKIIAIGVVCHTDSSYEISLFEKAFYAGVFRIFRNMDECITWAENYTAED